MKTPKQSEHEKIIFLDFDGVLNSVGTKDRVIHPLFKRKVRGLDNFRVKLVSDLAKETGSSIVISSSWRHFYSELQLKVLLYSRGLEHPFIVGVTPTASQEEGWTSSKMNFERSDEIQAWMNIHGRPKYFLVLDDLETAFTRNQIKTSDGTGFFDGLMKRAKSILSIEAEYDS